MNTAIINIPFQGFYQSTYNGSIDSNEEQEAEHFHEEDPRLDAIEYASILWHCADYPAMFVEIAKRYTECFCEYIREETGVELGLEFEEMTSPREYNFTTDRIFAKIPLWAMGSLRIRTDKLVLAAAVRDRHSSRDGFISFYPNKLSEWPQEIQDWDENHLGTLLAAFMEEHVDKDWGWAVYYKVDDCGFIGEVYPNCVDWTKFEELKAEKLAELVESCDG